MVCLVPSSLGPAVEPYVTCLRQQRNHVEEERIEPSSLESHSNGKILLPPVNCGQGPFKYKQNMPRSAHPLEQRRVGITVWPYRENKVLKME